MVQIGRFSELNSAREPPVDNSIILRFFFSEDQDKEMIFRTWFSRPRTLLTFREDIKEPHGSI